MKSTNTSSAKKNGTPPKRKDFRRLMALNRSHWKQIALAALCVLLVNTALLAKPYIMEIVIDNFLMKKEPQKGIYSLNGMGILYFVVVALSCFFNIAQVNLINRAGQEIIRDLRARVFRTIQHLPLCYLDRNSSGNLITRATNDVESLSQFYTDVLLELFQDSFLVLGIVCAMLSMDVRLTGISFCIIPIMLTIIILLRTKVKRNFQKIKRLIGRINGFMAENISGMKLVQIFHGEKEKKQEFQELNDSYYKATSFQVWINSILRPASTAFQNLAIAVLFWYSMGEIAGGVLQIGVLYAFTTYIRQFFGPVSNLAESYTKIQSAFVSVDRIFELLDQENTLEDLDRGVGMKRIAGSIEFKHVWFSYDNREWVLKDVSFTIRKDQTAAFVGETGAGKTTIISLVSGFYQVQKGEILIDGVHINDIKKRDLRRNIAVVLQDVFLFSGTIGSNITLNDPIPPSVVQQAVHSACSEGFVDSLPGKIEEPVMERGNTLSAGQRQLVSFARAIAHQPSIIVLDEATANIDSYTERLIQSAIENISRNRTALIIAHRLSTIRGADKIIVLKNGRVVETGTHRELMKKGGYYSAMEFEGTGGAADLSHLHACRSVHGGSIA